jgi:hypothetical protein
MSYKTFLSEQRVNANNWYDTTIYGRERTVKKKQKKNQM